MVDAAAAGGEVGEVSGGSIAWGEAIADAEDEDDGVGAMSCSGREVGGVVIWFKRDSRACCACSKWMKSSESFSSGEPRCG
jgi:hypothetical protein